MLLSVVLLEIFAAVVTLCFAFNMLTPLIKSYKNAKSLDVVAKGPKTHWFFGHVGQFGKTSQERLKKLTELAQSFPALFNVWRGPAFSAILMYHPDPARSFVTSGAPKDDFAYQFLKPWLGDGLLISKGKKWQRNRHLLTPAFHFSILKPYTEIYNQSCRVMLDKWADCVGKPLEVHDPISLMALDTMIQCAMSSRTNCQNVKGKHPYIKAIRELAESVGQRTQNPFYFFDWIYFLTPAGRRFSKAADIVHKHAETIIAERRKALEDLKACKSKYENVKNNCQYGGKKLMDFLDILLQTRDDQGQGLSDAEIRDEVDTFLFEGHDTTASGMAWATYNLAKYPEFQKKCREEVMSVIGEKENVEWDDLQKFPYLTKFIKESLRLYPPVVFIGRKLNTALTVRSDVFKTKEVVIPENSNLSFNLFCLHRNEHIWKNPTIFDPERFSQEECAKRDSYAYLPFSAGSRNCIGQNFAMNEMKTVLAQILKRYELYLDEETPTPIVETRVILQSKDGIYVKIKPM
ncbi:cytochrome P450 4F1-like [Clavelina lepadiformis]|uniref:cytochrome P450 4F1-like n=1 Tax=Clavelina lepadiformis TaxID=159417 RepID=UPI00404327CF